MKIKIILILIAAILKCGISLSQVNVIKLYPGLAPGSENMNYQEKEMFSPIFNTQVVYNVSRPSMQAFLPDPSIANRQNFIYMLRGDMDLE